MRDSHPEMDADEGQVRQLVAQKSYEKGGVGGNDPNVDPRANAGA